MGDLFLASAIVGGLCLLVQLAMTALGVDHDSELGGAGLADGLNLLSLRSLFAGLTFFGLGGMLGGALGLSLPLALALGLAFGLAAALAVAWLMRSMLRMEADGSVDIEQALGQAATVYLRIPGERAGLGKVTVVLQGRSVEYQAVSSLELPTGTPVVVVDVLGPDTVEVAPPPVLGGSYDV